MTKPKPDVQEQLRQAITSSGQSLNAVASAAGLDSGRLSRFMRGERDLTFAAVARLCQTLGLKLAGVAENGSDPAPEKPSPKRPGKKKRA
jgi:transcriptional regulator with XRE-family HTH domain